MTEILIILVLILCNGVFSGAEIAIISLRKTRLAELVEAGSRRARAVAHLREDPERFLATVQIGITVIGATAAAFGGSSVAAELAPLLAGVPLLAPYAEKLAFGLVVALVSFLSLVLGELVPKSLALRAGESYALLVGPPLRALAWAGRPVVALLTGTSNLVLRLFGDRTTFTEARLSREEIQQIVEEAATAGAVDRRVGEIASRALDFSALDAHAVMVPRRQVVMLPLRSEPGEIARIARRSGHARLPVYYPDPDHVLGFVNLREVLAEAVLGPSLTLEALVHPISYVPESMAAPAVLQKLQQERCHLAVVLDEQGTMVGLVTIEDLLEELVGEIYSENDPKTDGIQREAEGVWLVAGTVPVHEVNRALDLELPEGEYSTIAGLCNDLAGAIPQAGAVFEGVGDARLEVVEASPRRVRRVRVRRVAPARDEES